MNVDEMSVCNATEAYTKMVEIVNFLCVFAY